MDYTLEFNNVWKKFRKGEKFNSLRDAIPNFFRNIGKGKSNGGLLEDQEFWAVKDVSFKLKKGEIIGIIGPNGAGKSTILKLLSGILAPNKGSMKMNGRMSALIEVTAGFHAELTGRENVYLNGSILGMKKKEIDSKFDDIVEFSGVGEFIDTPVKRYSSGMYSRLGFAVAAHIDPDILLVDEVLAVGDMAFQAKCAEKMRELFKSGVTIVLISHNIPLIRSLCERVILLNHGEVLKEGKAEEVIPFYENLVFLERKEEFNKNLMNKGQKVKLDTKTAMSVFRIDIMDREGRSQQDFEMGSEMKIRIHYKTEEKIDNPIFVMYILRSDGVVCCASNSKADGHLKVGALKDEGTVEIDFGQLSLMPGLYVVRLVVWDKLQIHPFVQKKDDVFCVTKGGQKRNSRFIFYQDLKWSLGK